MLALPESTTALTNRFQLASDAEDFWERVGSAFVGNSQAWSEFTLGGLGLGLSANMTNRFLGGAFDAFLLAETEPERVMLAGGVTGLVWLAIKTMMCIAGVLRSFQLFATQGQRRPLLLWLTASYALIAWPISGQLSAQVIGWLAVALAGNAIGFNGDRVKSVTTNTFGF